MAECHGQDSNPTIRLSPSKLKNVQAVNMECGPGSNSNTYIKEKVVAEAAEDRPSLSKSPLPEEMPPPTAEGTPVGTGATPVQKRKRGAATPNTSNSQPKGKTAKVGQSGNDSTISISPSQKSNTSGREQAGRESDSLASQKHHSMEESSAASIRAVMLSEIQESNSAPSAEDGSVGSSVLEPGGTEENFLNASRHNAQRYRARHERNKPGSRAVERLDGNKRSFQPKKSTGPPAFVEFPVVLQDVPGPVLFSKLGPWKRTELLKAVCGSVDSIRPIQSGKKFLIGCKDEGQQGKLSRCQSLPGDVGIRCRIPVPTVEGVLGPIPLGDWALKQVKVDLMAGGHRVTGVARLRNRKGEPSKAVKVTFESCTLPAEVWVASTPYQVAAFAASVRRCTKCQSIGHTKSQCRSRVPRCSRCGTAGHVAEGCSNTLSCVNCNGRHSAAFKQCPEMLVHARANILRSSSYIPFSVALQRARGELFGGSALPESTENNQDSKPKPDRCWAVDRATAAANPLTTGNRPAPSYASVAARGVGVGRTGGGGGHEGRPVAGRDRVPKVPIKPDTPRSPPPRQEGSRVPAPKKREEGVRVATAQGGGSTNQQKKSKKVHRQVQVNLSTSTSRPVQHTVPIASREQLLERAARLRPTFLARQRQRREADLLAKQKKTEQLQRVQLKRDLHSLDEKQKKARKGVPSSHFQNMLWDLLVTLANTRISGDPDALLALLTKIIGRATLERVPSLPLTKRLDVMLVLAGAKTERASNHKDLPDFVL